MVTESDIRMYFVDRLEEIAKKTQDASEEEMLLLLKDLKHLEDMFVLFNQIIDSRNGLNEHIRNIHKDCGTTQVVKKVRDLKDCVRELSAALRSVMPEGPYSEPEWVHCDHVLKKANTVCD